MSSRAKVIAVIQIALGCALAAGGLLLAAAWLMLAILDTV